MPRIQEKRAKMGYHVMLRGIGIKHERTVPVSSRRDPQYSLSAEEVIRICLVAAASHKDPKKWRDFIDEWLTELTFSDGLEGDDGKVLHSHLQCLCHAVPELWVSCGRAEAALVAYNAQIC